MKLSITLAAVWLTTGVASMEDTEVQGRVLFPNVAVPMPEVGIPLPGGRRL